jgi:hypothetical protein
MDGGIEQNPAYGTAQALNLQVKSAYKIVVVGSLTPRSTPTGSKSVRINT